MLRMHVVHFMALAISRTTEPMARMLGGMPFITIHSMTAGLMR